MHITNRSSAILAAVALVAALAAPGIASAAFVLDTGAPPAGSTLGGVLDGNDFSAAEFTLSAGSTVTGIQAFVTQGFDQPGATFTLAIYFAADFGSRNSSPLFTTQATYGADGWNGVSGLSWLTASSGQYWAAVEVGATDTAIGLALPAPAAGSGTVPAQAFAFNSGSGYTTTGANPFGIEVTATTPVPLPAAAWLLGSGILGLGSRMRRRRLPVSA